LFINRLKRKDLIISLLLVAYKSHIKVLKVLNHSRFWFKFTLAKYRNIKKMIIYVKSIDCSFIGIVQIAQFFKN
jgi:hypothetical protein